MHGFEWVGSGRRASEWAYGVGMGVWALGVGRRCGRAAMVVRPVKRQCSRCPQCESANSMGLCVELGGLAGDVDGLGGETVIGRDVQSWSLATQELGVLPPR